MPVSDGVAEGPLPRYRALVRSGAIRADDAQRAAVEKLQLLHLRLRDYDPARGKRVALGWFGFGRKAARADKPLTGLYLFGGVGRGKSMLMDLFFASAPVERKRRVHFHAFMQEIHAALHAARAAGAAAPIATVAEQVAREAVLLCFDELQVTNIADAMILGRLFEALFAHGVVVVATSNQAPDELYRDGLSRELFLPFIALIKERMDIIELATPIDYRQRPGEEAVAYFTPLGPVASAAMEAAWRRETRGAPWAPLTLSIHGRRVRLDRATEDAGWASFAALCEAPLGAADYLMIAERFSTFFVEGIRRLSWAENNEAARLMTLIDTFYEARMRLYCSAETPPEEIYTEGKGADAFARTASRLAEMRHPDWMRR